MEAPTVIASITRRPVKTGSDKQRRARCHFSIAVRPFCVIDTGADMNRRTFSLGVVALTRLIGNGVASAVA
ncbi:hypothetical protein GCM10007989_19250 [Devosia pacifica]|uniref:Uncharacterized protein n=1 Tax=Devosia pacifica TaxID=1335967 RepID=A0A918VUD5_9HYPH|nr:hypothetical protein GCM10007989_19250 [Devosia pacifica]